MAKSFYTRKKNTPFIPEFKTQTPLPSPSNIPMKIDVDHLSRFAKHPLRFYCNQTLNLYFPFEGQIDEEFQLSPLKKSELSHETFEEGDRRGHVPLGRFKEVAKRGLEKKSPTHQESIDLTLEHFHIVGTLEIPLSDKKRMQDKIKIYPLSLIYQKNHEALFRYLHYYQVSLLSPSPLHPDLAEALLKKDVRDFEKKIFKDSLDPYFKSLFAHADPQIIFDTWAPFLRTVLKEV